MQRDAFKVAWSILLNLVFSLGPNTGDAPQERSRTDRGRCPGVPQIWVIWGKLIRSYKNGSMDVQKKGRIQKEILFRQDKDWCMRFV